MKMNKLCATAMAVVMAMSAAAVPAFADDAAKSATTNVTATVNGSYSIIVPESITLTGTSGTGVKSAIISVTLKGDIPEDKTVNVTTTAPVMKCTGAKDVTATVETPKTSWNRTDLLANSNAGTKSDYTVQATLTPGEWSGVATFNCSLDAAS